MTDTRSNLISLAGAVLTVLGVSLLTRSLIPIDETRYTGVAWEMWLRGDLLVPHLNGAPYSHKPALLFWLIMAGWKLFGVNEWWPRVLPFLFSFASLWLVARLAQRIWPQGRAAVDAPVILLGFTLWAFFTTTVMFDMLLAFFILLAIDALYRALHGDGWRWWLVLGFAWGFGMLSKGPVIFLHTLSLLLLARWWVTAGHHQPLRSILGGFLVAFLLSALVIFAWVVPAILAGGEDYGRALLFGQNIERMVQAPNDRLPWWFYLPFLPLIAFPWFYWRDSWRALRPTVAGGWRADPGLRFCLAWIVPVLLVFSFLVSGKKIHYLLPLLPAIALLLARRLDVAGMPAGRFDLAPLGLVYLAVALALAWVTLGPAVTRMPAWADGISSWASVPLTLLAISALLPRGRYPGARVWLVTLQSLGLLLVVHLFVLVPAMRGYDLGELSRRISELQARGITVAHVGKYQDEYHFRGRLREPLVLLREETQLGWLQENPQAWVVSYRYAACDEAQEPAEYMDLYRNSQCVTLRTVAQQLAVLAREAEAGR